MLRLDEPAASMTWRATFIILACVSILANCSGHATDQSSAPAQNKGSAKATQDAVPVSTAKVVEKVMPVNVTAVGTGEAIQTVQIHTHVTGYLSEIHFARG